MQRNYQSGQFTTKINPPPKKKCRKIKRMYCTVEIFEYLKVKKFNNLLSNFVTYFSSPGVDTPVNVHTMG